MPDPTNRTSPADGETADAALRRMVDAYGGQLYALGLRFCGDRTEAEDMVQDVFLNAYRGWHGFEGRSSEKTWLYTIAVRACQRMHRRRAGEPSHVGSLDETLPFGESLIAMIPAEQDDPLQAELRTEAREQVEAAIVGLPDDFRIPLVLRDIAGFSVHDVGQMLGLEEATVRTRVHRARLKLRAAVDRVLPRASEPAPPPAYEQQTCLDLLRAKQLALDHGVPFDDEVLCERCRSVFASLDLTQEVCRDLAGGALPDDLRARLTAAFTAARAASAAPVSE